MSYTEYNDIGAFDLIFFFFFIVQIWITKDFCYPLF